MSLSHRPVLGVALLLLAVSVVVGTALDAGPPRPVEFRAGYRVLQVEFHAHTRMSDGLLSPPGLVLQAQRRGLDAVAVTEHNMVAPGKIARWYSALVGGPIVLVGQEVSTWRFHMHAVGIEEAIDGHLPLEDAIAAIHAQGGVAIAAHPVQKYWPHYDGKAHLLDGTEVGHPILWSPPRAGWDYSHLVTFYQRSLASGAPLAAIGASDYHFFSPMGVIRTLVFVPPDRADAAGIVDAVRARRTVVKLPDRDRYFGPPELVAALRDDPLTPRPADYKYDGRNAVDVVFRWLALLAIAALLFVRRRSPAALSSPP